MAKKYKDFHYEEQPGKRKRAFNLQRYLDNQKKKKKTPDKEAKKEIKEDAPTNSMGASSSANGPVQSYDPMLMKNKKKLLPFSVFRRVKGRKQNVGGQLGS